MPAGVADGLLGNAKERELDLRRQSLLRASIPCVSTDTSVPHSGGMAARLAGHDEPALLEQARPQTSHQRPHIVQRIAHQRPRGQQLLTGGRWRTIEGIDRQIDSEQRRGQRLRRTIVEIARQTAPLVFASARRSVRGTASV